MEDAESDSLDMKRFMDTTKMIQFAFDFKCISKSVMLLLLFQFVLPSGALQEHETTPKRLYKTANCGQYQTGGQITGSPVISDSGSVYVPCCDSKLYKLSANCSFESSWELDSGLVSTPIVSNRCGIIVVSSGGIVSFPEQKNHSRINLKWAVCGSPGYIDETTIVVGDAGGKLYFIDTPTSSIKKTIQLKGDMGYTPLIQSAPVSLKNGAICVGTEDCNIYFVDHNYQTTCFKTNGAIR